MVYTLVVTLEGIEPPIWRRLRVSSDLTLAQLHDVLQIAMGWTNSHLHQFHIGDERYATPTPFDDDDDEGASDDRKTRLRDVTAKRWAYEYDFGDGWEHSIVVEESDAETLPVAALCVAGARACPPEDCGGVGGYEELLEVLADPAHEQYKELREWTPEDFDAEAFDLALTNQFLALHGPKLRPPSGRKR